MFRILTSAQYDAICDIVTDLQKENEKLKAQIAKKEEIIDYLNKKVFASNERYVTMLKNMRTTELDVDFPATTKQPEDKFY